MKRKIFYLVLLLATQTIMGSELTTAICSFNIIAAKQLILARKGINTLDEYGRTPLMYTAIRGQLELCKLLITNGAAVDVEDSDGFTALDHMYGQPPIAPEVKKQIIDLLEDAHLKQQGKVIPVDSTAATQQGIKDYLEMIKGACAEKGITNNLTTTNIINVQDATGKTALMEYAAAGDIEACKYLVRNGAKADVKDKKGQTAIDYVCTKLKQPDDKLKAEIIELLKGSPKPLAKP